MLSRPRFFVWLAILCVFIGKACDPASAVTALTSNASPTPVANRNIGIVSTQPSTSPVSERTVHVDALNVQSDPRAGGGTNAVDVRIRRVATPGNLHLGFIETGVGAIGAQWHASGWEAVLLVSMMTGTDPTTYEFDFTNQGYIDGPSAGGLMTVAVLAVLRGAARRCTAPGRDDDEDDQSGRHHRSGRRHSPQDARYDAHRQETRARSTRSAF